MSKVKFTCPECQAVVEREDNGTVGCPCCGLNYSVDQKDEHLEWTYPYIPYTPYVPLPQPRKRIWRTPDTHPWRYSPSYTGDPPPETPIITTPNTWVIGSNEN